MKKNNINRLRRIRHRKPEKPNIEFSTFSIEPSEKLQAALIEEAKYNVAEFTNVLELVKNQFHQNDPMGIMASFATYTDFYMVKNDGTYKPLLKNVQQHHSELLQAVLLTIPSEEWGLDPLTPGVMGTLFEALPKLSDTFFHQRVLAASKISDKQEILILSLQERIRLHTQAIRNWGYFTEVIKISTELYEPLDSHFTANYGFSITDLIQVMKSVVTEYEHRTNEHFNILQKVLRGENNSQLVRLYFESVSELDGTPDEMIAALPAGINRKKVLVMLMAHLDLRLSEYSTFKADEIAVLSKRKPEMVKSILKAISLPPGELVNISPEHLFLGNPIWTAPSISLGESIFIPMPHIVFSHIHSLVTRLGQEAGLKKKLERARARYLESKTVEIVKIALPDAIVSANLKWQARNKHFETDCLAIIDRMAVIVEAKSHQLCPEGMRGAPKSIKRYIRNVVLKPSIQSNRLEKVIVDAKSGDTIAIATMKSLGIDASKIDHVIRLSVTLDDLWILYSAEGELKQINWIPEEHDLAPTISIADFMCLTDILNCPIHLLHYLSERSFVQKSFQLMGDELDCLGLYLDTGFNLSEVEKHADILEFVGLSNRIDEYYISREAGEKFPKPQIKLSSLYRAIIERLSRKRHEGWTIAGLHLLNSADYHEQRKIEKKLVKLKRMVRKNYMNPKHLNSLVIQPPKNRKASVIFYLYPNELYHSHKSMMEKLVSETLKQSQVEECCIFGRCIDNWKVPYESLCIGRKRKLTVDST